MSDMHEGYRDPFDAIVSGLQVGRTLPMNGINVLADAELGDEMRRAFQNIGNSVISNFVVQNGQLSRKQVKHLDRVMYKEVKSGRAPAKLHELIAVSGHGVYLAYPETEEGVDSYMALLEPGQTLFGYFEEVNYNSYPFVDDIEHLQADYDDEIDVEDADGLVMALGAVMLCDSEGYGTQRDGFDHAVIPLHVPEFTMYKTPLRYDHDAA